MAEAYYSDEDRCWYVPVASELLAEGRSVEPVRLELRDKQLVITELGRLYAFTDEEARAVAWALEPYGGIDVAGEPVGDTVGHVTAVLAKLQQGLETDDG